MSDAATETPGTPMVPPPPESASTVLVWLRRIAVLGTIVFLLWQASALAHLGPRQAYGFAVLILALLAVTAALFLLLTQATRHLLEHKDLLLPLGLWIACQAVLQFLMTVPGLTTVLTPSWTLRVLTLSFSLSLAFLIQTVLAILYAGWVTRLVWQVVLSGVFDTLAGLGEWRRWLGRVLAVECIGWGGLFLTILLAVFLASLSIGLALFVIGVATLVWNLATATLLLTVLEDQRPLRLAVREGIQLRWHLMRRWWLPVLVQMLLLGWVTLIHLTYSTGSQSGSVTYRTMSNWSVNGFWTGSYEDTCRWYSKLMEAAEAEAVPIIALLLQIAFAVLAIAIKLHIAMRMVVFRSLTVGGMNVGDCQLSGASRWPALSSGDAAASGTASSHRDGI